MVKKFNNITTDQLAEMMNNSFIHLETKMDEKFDAIDQKFETIDLRFNTIDKRFDGIDVRLDRIEGRVERLEDKMLQVGVFMGKKL